MKHKTLFWAALFALLAAASGALYLLGGREGATAVVYVDGQVYERVDLSAAVTPYELTVETEYGTNVLRVSRGAIQVTEADCPGRDCVRQGAVSDSLIPIVCLPHHLVIQIEEPAT